MVNLEDNVDSAEANPIWRVVVELEDGTTMRDETLRAVFANYAAMDGLRGLAITTQGLTVKVSKVQP